MSAVKPTNRTYSLISRIKNILTFAFTPEPKPGFSCRVGRAPAGCPTTYKDVGCPAFGGNADLLSFLNLCVSTNVPRKLIYRYSLRSPNAQIHKLPYLPEAKRTVDMCREIYGGSIIMPARSGDLAGFLFVRKRISLLLIQTIDPTVLGCRAGSRCYTNNLSNK